MGVVGSCLRSCLLPPRPSRGPICRGQHKVAEAQRAAPRIRGSQTAGCRRWVSAHPRDQPQTVGNGSTAQSSARASGTAAQEQDGVRYVHVGIAGLPGGDFTERLAYCAFIPWALFRYRSDLVVEDLVLLFRRLGSLDDDGTRSRGRAVAVRREKSQRLPCAVLLGGTRGRALPLPDDRCLRGPRPRTHQSQPASREWR